MAKKVENMTHDELYEYYEKKREKERIERQKIIDTIPEHMIRMIADLANKADKVATTGGYGCNGGVKYLPAFDLQELEDAVSEIRNEFNLIG